MGCTEPIAIAYGAAYARKVLGKDAERYEVECSGNIIKNVKAVTVPQTNGLKGIETAVLAGAIGGDADKELEVLTTVTEADIEAIKKGLADKIVTVKPWTPSTPYILLSTLSPARTAFPLRSSTPTPMWATSTRTAS